MGIKLFRNDNWDRIRNGDKDRELIGYMIAHAPEPRRRSMMQYAVGKYGMDGFPKPRINTDDSEDTFFWEYAVLREQVVREEDREVLEAALHDPDRSVAAFAFCRLTGYSFPPDECDAYSYRTFSCDILPGMTDAYREAIWDCCISLQAKKQKKEKARG